MKKTTILIVSILLIGSGTAFALPITVNSVNSSNTANVSFTTYNGGANTTVHTVYSLNTSLGNFDAFCVEGVASGTGSDFHIDSVPSDTDMQNAAWIAEQFWTTGNVGGYTSKEDVQILIWEAALGDIFTYNSGSSSFIGAGAVNTHWPLYFQPPVPPVRTYRLSIIPNLTNLQKESRIFWSNIRSPNPQL